MYKPLIDFIYPNLCPGCNEPIVNNEGAICLHCQTSLPITNFYKDPENPISKLFWGRVKLEFAFGSLYFVKEGLTQNLIHALKYQNNEDVGLFLGKLMGKEIKLMGVDVDFIIPVPLHPKKLKSRGYNQSDYLANGVVEVLQKTTVFSDALIRVEHSSSQTKKNKYQRWENVGNIFEAKHPNQLIGKHVVLIDDVVTTGSTIEACVQALSEIDDIKISVVTAAVPIS